MRVLMLHPFKKLFTRDTEGLHVTLPGKAPGKIAFALKIRS